MYSYEELRQAGETFFGEKGAWIYEKWAELNNKYFEGKLEPGPILWGLTPHGSRLGHYAPAKNEIVIHPSCLQPTERCDPWGINYTGQAYAKDVLLHETIHQNIHQAGMYIAGPSSHNCQAWIAEIKRISEIMGIKIQAKVIKQKRLNNKVTWFTEPGHLNRKELAAYPHSIRPENYHICKDNFEYCDGCRYCRPKQMPTENPRDAFAAQCEYWETKISIHDMTQCPRT